MGFQKLTKLTTITKLQVSQPVSKVMEAHTVAGDGEHPLWSSCW